MPAVERLGPRREPVVGATPIGSLLTVVSLGKSLTGRSQGMLDILASRDALRHAQSVVDFYPLVI